MIFEGVKFSQKCKNSDKTALPMLFLVSFSVFPEKNFGERGQPHWPVFNQSGAGERGRFDPFPLPPNTLTPTSLVSAPDSMIIR